MNKPEALQLVDEAAARFAAQCERASERQWTFRPDAGAWSMADVAEHVCIANRGILGRLSKSLLDASLAGRVPDVIDPEIPYLFYRGDEPPGVATPTGTWGPWVSVAGIFRQSFSAIHEWADATRIDLRAYGVMHPVFGVLDGVQWLLFIAAHTERHRAQVIGLEREAVR